MRKKLLIAAIISFFIAGLAAYALGSSETTNLGLTKPAKGDRNWDQTINNNMDLLDAAYGNYTTTADDLPQVYVYSDTFNSTTGRTITLPNAVDAVTEYSVTVTPTTRAGAIGDIYVTKAITNFVVKCSEANTTDTFAAVVYYIGDVSNYGGSIYRRWYVSPDNSITDHANASTTGSIAWVQAQISTNQAIIELPGNKNYQIKNNLTLNDSLRIMRQMGAIIDTDFSIRDSNYEWYKNGATNEYYLQALGGGNPNINMPSVAIENNAQMTDGAAGSLVAGEWDWNDVNGLGYSTVYVRLSDSTDPDGKSADYVEAGYTLTINAVFDPAPHQAFAGEGKVIFGVGAVREASPELFGASNDGTNATQTTSAINRCAAAAKDSLTTVAFSEGVYLVDGSLNFTEANQTVLVWPKEGWLIKGTGSRSTIIKPELTEAYPVMDITGSAHLTIRDLSVYGYTNTGLQNCGILSAYSSTGGGHRQVLRNVFVRGYFNGGAAFASSCSDQFLLSNSFFTNLEGPGAVFTTSIISGVSYLTATIDSKFATITTQGNTKITTRDCSFTSDDSDTTIFDGYGDWEDTGSYWACTGTSSKALNFYGKAGGSSLSFTGIRMETDHSSVDAVGIYIHGSGAGGLSGGHIQGRIEGDTNSSHAIQSLTHTIENMYINVVKTDSYTSSLIDGNIAKSIIILPRNANHSITNYGVATCGNIILGGNNLGNWTKTQSMTYKGSTVKGYSYNSIHQKNRHSVVGESTTEFGREFGGIIKQAGGYPASDGGGEKVLYTYLLPSFPQPSLHVDKPVINVKSWGKTAGNANAKTIKLYLKWYNDSTATTNDWVVVSNDITGSPNSQFWLIEGTIEDFHEFLGKMLIGSTMQTVNSKRINDGESFEWGVDTLTIEVRSDAALNDVTGYKFIVSY